MCIRYRHLMVAFLSVTLAIMLTFSISAKASETRLDEAYFLETTLCKNSHYNHCRTGDSLSESTLSLRINQQKTTMHLQVHNSQADFVGELTGSAESVNVENNHGYVGVYEGLIKNNQSELWVIADVVFTDEEAFSLLTIQTSQGDYPQLAYFGELTGSLGAISSAYSEKLLETLQRETAVENQLNKLSYPLDNSNTRAVDAEIREQLVLPIRIEQTEVGELSIYHANELRNQSSTPIRMRINTDTYAMVDYLEESIGIDNEIFTAFADKVYFTVEAFSDNMQTSTSSCSPASGSRKTEIPIPYYDLINDEWTYGTFEIARYSCEIETDAYSDDSYGINAVSWTLTNTNGWPASNTDGSSTSRTGLGVCAEYGYNGTLSSDTVVVMEFRGKIRYMYISMLGSDTFTGHLTTKEAKNWTAIDILND